MTAPQYGRRASAPISAPVSYRRVTSTPVRTRTMKCNYQLRFFDLYVFTSCSRCAPFESDDLACGSAHRGGPECTSPPLKVRNTGT